MSTDTPSRLAWLWKVALPALALFGITLWLFWPATGYDFLNFDDDRYVMMNRVVRDGITIAGIKWALKAVYESYWLPIIWLSYMLDSTLFGKAAFGYHFTNVVLHAINAALLFVLIRKWTKSFWAAFFVAALFAWHPLRVESVAWITERKDVLSGLFFLLALLSYTKYSERPGMGREVPAALFMALGLMTKPILVTLPFLLLLLDYWPFRRWEFTRESLKANAWTLVSEKVLFWSLMVLFCFVTYYTQTVGEAIHSSSAYPWLGRIVRVPIAFAFYLKKTVWPFDLSVIYGNLPLSVSSLILSILLLLALTAIVLWMGRRSGAAAVGWFWFLGLLMPVIGLIRVGVVHVADRFTYLPSIGLALAVASGAIYLQERRRWLRPLFAVLAVVIASGCVWQTRHTLPTWTDSLSIFENALRYVKDSAVAQNNYGQALMDVGRFEESLSHFDAAVALDPRSSAFAGNRGLALVSLGRLDEAIDYSQRLLQKEFPNDPFLHFTIASAWVEKGQPEKALRSYAIANSSRVQRVIWHLEFARALYQAGKLAEASNQFAFVDAAGFPWLANFDGLCTYYAGVWEKGDTRRAWNFFKYAIEAKPDSVPLLNNVAWFLATSPAPDVPPQEAVRIALQAKDAATPVSPSVLDTLSVASAVAGDFDGALHWSGEALAAARKYGLTDLAERIEQRRKLFEQGIAWRPAPLAK